MARRTSDRRRIEITHPVSGKVIPIRTPKGTIPAVALVRAFKEARTDQPDGSVRFSSQPLQAVLERYSEQLDQAAEIERQRAQVHHSQWKELGLNDTPWIKFRHVFRKLISTFLTPASS